MRSALLIGCLSLFAMLPILAIAGAGSGSRVAKEELIPAALTVEGIGTTDIELVYRKNSAYLPILAIFHFIRVKSEFSPTKGAINGFYPTPGSPFSLDLLSGKITTRDTSSTLTTEEYTFSEDEAYVREDVFRAIFHMSIRYDPRRLAVILKPDRSLPYFAAYQREEARKRALNRPERIAPDFEIYRTTSLLNGGKFVWNLSSQIAEDFRPRNSYRFDLGGEFLDGDLDANAAGLFGNRLREQNFHGTLSYPIEPPFPVREAVFGDLNSYTPSPFSIFGAELTNRPYTRRITFSQEDYAAEIPANEEVELYSGNRLVDYFQSTNDTLKHFGLPLIYGVESYDLRMYNQWGELNQSQFREVIPRQMTPPYEFDYTVSGGIIRGFNKAAGSVALSEGLTSLLTVGAGADYYQPGFTRRVLYPYANGTIRLLSSLYGDVAVSPLSASHATLELQLPNQLLADLTQQIMAEDPVLNPSGILSQTTFFFNTPIFLKETSGLAAGASAQNTIGSYYHQQTFVVSGNYYFPNFQIAYSGVYTAADNTTVQRESNPSISIRAPYSIGIQGAFTYDHGLNQFRSASLSADRFVYRDIFLQFSLDRVFNPNATFALLRLNYVLPFARFATTAQRQFAGGNAQMSYGNTATGSVLFSPASGDVLFRPTQFQGQGAILVKPFVDSNGNDVHDPGEEYLPDVQVFSGTAYVGSSTERTSRGTLLLNALPYQEYFASLDTRFLDNPLWVPRYRSVAIVAMPNMLTTFVYPIVVGGNLRGKVTFTANGVSSPVEAITVTLRPKSGNTKNVKTVKTFSTGEFEFNAVLPGEYDIELNPSELSTLGVTAESITKSIQVRALPDGDQITGIDFDLK